jgi:FixJ family two-component response regulator
VTASGRTRGLFLVPPVGRRAAATLPPAPETESRDIGLSGREQQLLHLLVRGHTELTAAGDLNISSRTAEATLAALRKRVDAPSLYALGAIAERLGWHHAQDGAR